MQGTSYLEYFAEIGVHVEKSKTMQFTCTVCGSTHQNTDVYSFTLFKHRSVDYVEYLSNSKIQKEMDNYKKSLGIRLFYYWDSLCERCVHANVRGAL